MLRTSQRIKAERQYVESLLADHVICPRCGATLDTFSKQCQADLSDACAGFMAIDRAKAAFNSANPIKTR